MQRLRGLTACASAAALLAGAARAESLSDAAAMAYETNPTLQAERAQLRATDEEWPQAQAGYRPTVTADGSYTYQYGLVSAPGSPSATLGEGSGVAEITVAQPLYTGGRVATKVDAAQADILAEREKLRAAEISVLQSVIGAYVDVRRDADQLAISQDNVSVLQHQLDETTARFNAGQLTQTDVSQSEARLALAKSQLAGAQATLAEDRAAYVAVVGQAPGELAPEPSLDGLMPLSVDTAFDAAESGSPAMRQARAAEVATAARLAEAKAQTRPSVSLTGSVGYQGSQTGLGGTSGFSSQAASLESETGVSVGVSAQAPLFTGGLYASEIRQAAEQDNAAEIGVETARRQADQTVAQAWNQLLGARASLAADQEQVKADTTALEGVRQEEGVGLRTILDVLNAQQELETSQLALVGARRDAYVAEAGVLAAVGALDAKALSPAAPLYDPKANYDKVRHAPGWVPWERGVAALDHIGAPEPVFQTAGPAAGSHATTP
ncbi:MAG TPA: TolC family outer membrane protein [Caulobacteraceae bacterium]